MSKRCKPVDLKSSSPTFDEWLATEFWPAYWRRFWADVDRQIFGHDSKP